MYAGYASHPSCLRLHAPFFEALRIQKDPSSCNFATMVKTRKQKVSKMAIAAAVPQRFLKLAILYQSVLRFKVKEITENCLMNKADKDIFKKT